MMASVEQADGSYKTEERGAFVCGHDFCALCGECLACYSGDPCTDGTTGEHTWVIYLDETQEG